MTTIAVTPSRDADGRRRANGRGPAFDAVIGDRTAVRNSTTPLFDAARGMLAEGVPPDTRLVMRHAGAGHDALVSTVGAAAKLTVRDTGQGKPVFARWQSDRRYDGEKTRGDAPDKTSP